MSEPTPETPEQVERAVLRLEQMMLSRYRTNEQEAQDILVVLHALSRAEDKLAALKKESKA